MDISVIIATYNRVNQLPLLLEKWKDINLKTKYQYEIIFSDDGSDDNTVEFLKSFTELPIVTLKNKHGGAGKARNNAIKIASGKLLIFTGDDIYPDADFLNKHYETYLKNGNKFATLGRIEWYHNLKMNHLMKHITEIGCEQFGFIGLRAHNIADFRHFYTSNISIEKDQLNNFDEVFSSSFKSYGFEDIELGYRLFKNGINIYYNPDIIAEHDHVYNSVEKFSNRQFAAGTQLMVFKELHPEMTREEIKVDLDNFTDLFFDFKKNNNIFCLSYLGIVCIKLMALCTMLFERILKKYDSISMKKICSAFYGVIFSYFMNYGMAHQINSSSSSSSSIEKRFAIKYTFFKSLQIFYDKDLDFSEDKSVKIKTAGSNIISIKHEFKSNDTYHRLRIDPYEDICRFKLIKSKITLIDGKSHSIGVQVNNANKVDDNSFIFNICKDPQIITNKFELPIKSIEIECTLKYYVFKKLFRLLKIGFKYIFKLPLFFYRIKIKKINNITNLSLAEKKKIWIQIKTGNKELDIKLMTDYYIVNETFKGLFTISIDECHDEEFITFLYSPKDIMKSIDKYQFLNIALCLINYRYDFIIISNGLDEYPLISNDQIFNSLIFKENSVVKNIEDKIICFEGFIGKFIKIKGINAYGEKIKLESDYPSLKCYDKGVLNINNKYVEKNLCNNFISIKFDKPTIFVFPIFMAVGGVEKNTIEVIRALSDIYKFIVITFEKHTFNTGNLFYQLYSSETHFFDLHEVSFIDDYITSIQQLRVVYNPVLVWICNNNPWLIENTNNIRNIFTNIPIILQDAYDEKNGWIAYYDRPSIRCYDRFIAINQKVKNRFIHDFNIDPTCIDLIYSSIDENKIINLNKSTTDKKIILDKLGLKSGKYIFSYIGRLTDQKQPLKFIELAHEILKKYNNIQFVLVGDGVLYDSVQQHIKKYCLEDNIKYIKFIENIEDYIKAIDAVVMTSDYEGLSIVTIDALCLGTPIFSTDVGDIKLFVDSQNSGRICSSFSINDIIEEFNFFIMNLDTYKRNSEKHCMDNTKFFASTQASMLMQKSFSLAMDRYMSC